MSLKKFPTIEAVIAYYGKKYSKIMKALKELDATNFEIDMGCMGYLELWCDIKHYHIKINIGIDNKYHTWQKNKQYPFTETIENKWNNQDDVVGYLYNL
jgi:hypothetical protein